MKAFKPAHSLLGRASRNGPDASRCIDANAGLTFAIFFAKLLFGLGDRRSGTEQSLLLCGIKLHQEMPRGPMGPGPKPQRGVGVDIGLEVWYTTFSGGGNDSRPREKLPDESALLTEEELL